MNYFSKRKTYQVRPSIPASPSSRAASTRGLGDRFTGYAPEAVMIAPGPEESYIYQAELGKYFGHQDVSGAPLQQDLGKIHQFNFGGQDMRGLGLLSDNEKRLAAVGVLAIVGWFLFSKQIKKALK